MNLIQELQESGKDIVVVGYNGGDIALLKPVKAQGYLNILSGMMWPQQIESDPGVDWVIRYRDKCQMRDKALQWFDTTYHGIRMTSQYIFNDSSSHYKYIQAIPTKQIEAKTKLYEAREALIKAQDAIVKARVSLDALS